MSCGRVVENCEARGRATRAEKTREHVYVGSGGMYHALPKSKNKSKSCLFVRTACPTQLPNYPTMQVEEPVLDEEGPQSIAAASLWNKFLDLACEMHGLRATVGPGLPGSKSEA
jgi:hypothetical protein